MHKQYKLQQQTGNHAKRTDRLRMQPPRNIQVKEWHKKANNKIGTMNWLMVCHHYGCDIKVECANHAVKYYRNRLELLCNDKLDYWGISIDYLQP